MNAYVLPCWLRRDFGPAFFCALWRVCVLIGVGGAVFWAPAIRAEMLVLNGVSWTEPNRIGSAVFRFDGATGGVRGTFSHETEAYSEMTLSAAGELFITSNILGGISVQRFNVAGAYLSDAANGWLAAYRGMTRGPSGDLLSIAWDDTLKVNRILRFSGPTPTVLVESGAGGMTKPVTMVLGGDGNLYVSDEELGILRFNAATGAFVDVFVPKGRGGLTAASRLIFGPDGRLYVSGGGDTIYRYDASGAFVDQFVSGASGGLVNAQGLAFGPDGNFYVVCHALRQVRRYHGQTGAFLGVAASHPDMGAPLDVVFTPPVAEETVWFDDALPAGAVPTETGAPWDWSSLNFPISHASAHRVPYDGPGLRRQAFDQATTRLPIQTGDRLFAYVRLENHSNGPESAIMISWRDENDWEHRAYWGADVFGEGIEGTASRRYMGRLPRVTQWTRLEVPASLVGLEGRTVQGIALSVYQAGAIWDRVGKVSGNGADTSAPVVAISSPLANETVSGNVAIAVEATDTGSLTHLRVAAGGEVRWDAPYSGVRSFGWDTTTAANGPTEISVTATDAAGHQTTVNRAVVVSNGGPPPPAGDEIWFSDALPAGAQETPSTNDAWNWVTNNPAPYHGSVAHQSHGVPGLHSHTFAWAKPLPIHAGDVLVTYVYLNPSNRPREIMLSFKDSDSWEHRAYWGENLINYGANTAPSRVRMGDLPPAGQWVRLEVPASAIWMENRSLTGMSFSLYDGQATWDYTAKYSTTGGDRTPPTVTITSPADGAAVSGRLVVWSNSADNVAIAKVEMFVDGVLDETVIGNVTTTAMDWDTRTGTDGAHVIRVTATDTANNEASATINVTVSNADSTAPALTVHEPAASETVHGVDVISFTVTDSGSTPTVEILIDGAPFWQGTVSGWNSRSWDTRTLPNGPHTVTVVATDAAGNRRSVAVDVVVNNDDSPPSASFTSPNEGATVSAITEVAVDAVDADSGIHSVQFHVDGVFHSTDNTPPYAAMWDTRTVPNGAHTLRATVHNTNFRTTIVTRTVQVSNPVGGGGEVVWVDDDVPLGATRTGNEPWSWVTSPTPASGARAHQSTLAWNLHEHAFDWSYNNTLAVGANDTLFAYVYLDPANPPRQIMLSFKDNVSWEHRAYWGANLIGYGTDGTASRRRIGDLPAAGGWVRLEVPAATVGLENRVLYGMGFAAFDGRVTWDAAGKVTGGPGGGGDTIAPAVTLTSPASGATISGATVQLTADASDNVGVASVQFRIDGLNIGTADTAAPFGVEWNSATVANGTHTLTAVARDAAGNETTSAAVTVTVSNDTTPPAVTVWMEGALPAGAWGAGTGGDSWTWVTSNPASFSGAPAHQSNLSAGLHEHYFAQASQPLAMQAGDTFFVYVYLDPANPPQTVMLSFLAGENWEHRAYWGANLITFGTDGTASRRRIGDLPAVGQWVQLQVPAAAVGLEGLSIRGISFSLFGGRATWDSAGKVAP